MYQPPEFIYRVHNWRRSGKDTETGFILLQLPKAGFTVRDFIEIYQAHLTFIGRKMQRKDTIRSKLKYQWNAGYVVRKRIWEDENCWVEQLASGMEIREILQPHGEVRAEERKRIVSEEPTEDQQLAALERLAEYDRKRAAEKALYQQGQLEIAERIIQAKPGISFEPPEESTDDLMKKLGYG